MGSNAFRRTISSIYDAALMPNLWLHVISWREMERCECITEGGRSPVNLGSWLISQTVNQEIGFADDSPLEETGFELMVPLERVARPD